MINWKVSDGNLKIHEKFENTEHQEQIENEIINFKKLAHAAKKRYPMYF
jgi:hypothetical protein